MSLRNVLITLGVLSVLLLVGGFTMIIIGAKKQSVPVSDDGGDQRAELKSGQARGDQPPEGMTYDQREALRSKREAAE